MAPNHLSHIALLGATGNLGSHILTHLLSSRTFATVTVLTRPSTDVNALPSDPKLLIKRVEYSDHAALVSALTGVDALIITLNMSVPMETQLLVIDAAVEANVSWILPNEYGSDNANPVFTSMQYMAVKKLARDRVEERATQLDKPAKWIGIITNPWYDFCLPMSLFSINLTTRSATLFSGGHTKAYISTLDQVGRAVTALLSLPVSATKKGETALQDYRNGFIYTKSFQVSQRDILSAVQRVTGTTDKDWTIDDQDVDAIIEEGKVAQTKGERSPLLLFGMLFKEGWGGKYEGREVANVKLGLPEEDFESFTRAVVESK